MKTRIFRLAPALALLLALALAAPSRALTPDGWNDRVGVALAESARTGHPVLVDLYADWCFWCKKMEKEVFSTPQFREYAKNLVLLRVNVEDNGEGSDLRDRFGVENLPTLLVLDAKRAELGRLEGYLAAPALIAQLDAERAKYDQLLAAGDAALATADPATWLRFGKAFHQRKDGVHAAAFFQKLADAGAKNDRERRWFTMNVADSERLAGDPAAALATLAKLASLPGAADDRALGERVDLLRVLIAHEKGDCPSASSALAAFEREHPKSALLEDAKKSLHTLHNAEGGVCS